MKTTPKGPFLGINNRLPDFALHINTRQIQGDYLRDAVNVDVTNSGSIVRRAAQQKLVTLTNPHSLQMVDATHGYVVSGGNMYAVTLPTYTQSLFLILSNDDPVCYHLDGGSLYYSNGTDSGRIAGGVNYPWGMSTPSEPATSVIGGDLFKGSYQIATAYRNSTTGEVGGVSPSSNPALSAAGGFRVTMPPAVPGATHIDVYISTTNGSIPFLKGSVAVGTTFFDIIAAATGTNAVQRYEAPLPAGTQLFMFNGCLCSVKGNEVFEGIPFRPGYYLPAAGRIPFPADVSNAVPAQNGIYIVSDQTYWIPGTHITSAKDVIQDVLPYGGVAGTAFSYGDNDKIRYGWFGKHGIVLADSSGAVRAVMYDNVDLTPPTNGVSVVFFDRGYLRAVSCGWCLNLENNAATRYDGYDITSESGGFATMADGVYELSASGKVDAWFDLGKENFRTEQQKHLPAVYFGVNAETPMQLRVQTPEHDFTYKARAADPVNKIQRVDPGKGLRANWYNLTVSNTDGADFTQSSVSFATTDSKRKI